MNTQLPVRNQEIQSYLFLDSYDVKNRRSFLNSSNKITNKCILLQNINDACLGVICTLADKLSIFLKIICADEI